jgi:hypothetical protein
MDMEPSRFTEEQIIGILRENGLGDLEGRLQHSQAEQCAR